MNDNSKNKLRQIGIDTGQGKYYEEMVYGIGLTYISMINVIGSYLKDYDLSPTDMNVLMLVKHQGKDQGMSQVDLGQRLMVTAHNMTRGVQKLERKGLLKRMVDKQDARVNRIVIAPKGADLLDRIWPGYDMKLRELANNISVKEQEIMSGLLHKWLSHDEK